MARAELSLPGARGLKDKRRHVKGLVERLQSRFHVSAAEIDHQDTWRRAAVGVAVITTSTSHAHSVLSQVEQFIARQAELVMMEFHTEIR